jgi:DNA topoisomerase-1
MSPSEFDLLTVKILHEESNNVNTTDVNTNDVNTTDITKSKKISKKDSKKDIKKEHTDNNPLTFVGKHEKNTFLGFLECMNMHKKKVIKNALGDLEVIPEDEIHESEEEPDNEDKEDNEKNIPNSDYLEKIFNSLKENQEVFVQSMDTIQKYTKPIPRYTEASLIKMMESINLGRPSTFSATLTKIQEKQYVEKKNLPQKQVNIISLKYDFPDKIKIETKKTNVLGDKNKLVPTSLGIMINEFLCKNFIELMDYQYTAKIESMLDDIAENKSKLYDVIHLIYSNLTPIIDALSTELKSHKALKSADPKADSSSRRNLGVNPQNNLPIVCIKSKKGFLIIEENPVKKQSRFANFSSSFEDMTLDKALTLLVFPKNLGNYLEKDIIIKKAKNIYIQYGDSNYSIENYMNINKQTTIDPEAITFSEAKLIIDFYIKSKADKLENAKKDKVLNDDITIKTGPYGVYIKYKDNANIKLPKKYKDNIDSLTLEDALAIVEKHNTTPSKGSKASRFGAKGSAKPKPKSAEPKTKDKPKDKTKDKTKPKSAEVKPKVKKEKAPKAVKVKPVKTKF